ncbi:MAG: hypothetical protein ACYC7D_06390 [Nitrososphaerales archaeon]
MSYGNSGGSSGSRGHFGAKGSSQKKERKKKQEFHRHKIKYVEEQHLDFIELKERVMLSLQKLGQQVFSSEPGGYSLQDWMRSFNFLLDDFEERAGGTNLSKEYFDKRQALTAEILAPIDTSDIDQQAEGIRKEEDEIKLKLLEQGIARTQRLDQEKRSADSKIGSLKKERNNALLQIKREKEHVTKSEREPVKSPSLFKRFFSRSSTETLDPNERKIKELEQKAEKLQDEIQALENENDSKTSQANSANKDQIKEESERLATLRERLGELEASRAQRMQLSEKRERITKAMSEMISTIELSREEKAADANP